MNVLEKILKEIDKKADYYESDEQGREHIRMVDMVEVEEIIRSHMDEIPKCGECSRRKWYQIGYEDAKKENGWTPVSEHFPKKSGYYLVQTDRELSAEDYTDRVVSLYDANEGYFLSYHDYIVAWQPLSEPYKEREYNYGENDF